MTMPYTTPLNSAQQHCKTSRQALKRLRKEITAYHQKLPKSTTIETNLTLHIPPADGAPGYFNHKTKLHKMPDQTIQQTVIDSQNPAFRLPSTPIKVKKGNLGLTYPPHDLDHAIYGQNPLSKKLNSLQDSTTQGRLVESVSALIAQSYKNALEHLHPTAAKIYGHQESNSVKQQTFNQTLLGPHLITTSKRSQNKIESINKSDFARLANNMIKSSYEDELSRPNKDEFNTPAVLFDSDLNKKATEYYLHDPHQLNNDLAIYKTYQNIVRDPALKGKTVTYGWCDLPKTTAKKAKVFNELMVQFIKSSDKTYQLPWGTPVKVKDEPMHQFFSFWRQFV